MAKAVLASDYCVLYCYCVLNVFLAPKKSPWLSIYLSLVARHMLTSFVKGILESGLSFFGFLAASKFYFI